MASRKPQLPKSVLDMKFMKKTKERIQKELENTEDHDSLYSNIITNEMRSAAGGNYISESSFIYCEDLMDGRLSFKGMNPEIERLMELENEPLIKEEDMKKDVSDEVLAKKMEAFNQRKRPYSSPSTVAIKKKKH
ncbi:M-phase phosphoprotein 6 [Operophtera brumata]|uniref:M-phase phosphoprotein 6 n=1 Tax=Operophtera brumata TaxID=104452 RepID=A0A0L7LVL7_OPEBR|nr:M-phase phosphoprotein 6 [Operophtera brumata]